MAISFISGNGHCAHDVMSVSRSPPSRWHNISWHSIVWRLCTEISTEKQLGMSFSCLFVSNLGEHGQNVWKIRQNCERHLLSQQQIMNNKCSLSCLFSNACKVYSYREALVYPFQGAGSWLVTHKIQAAPILVRVSHWLMHGELKMLMGILKLKALPSICLVFISVFIIYFIAL